MSSFAASCLSAFAEVAGHNALELVTSSDGEWLGACEWHRGNIALRVSDDRRDNVTEVFVMREVVDGDLRVRHLMVYNDRLRAPLWAIIEARGGEGSGIALGSAQRRLEQLPDLAHQVSAYAGELLAGDWSLVDAIHDVVVRRHDEESEEGRRRGRFLP